MRSRDELIKEVNRVIEDFREDVLRARSRKSKRAKQGALQFYQDVLHHLTDQGGDKPELVRSHEDVAKDRDSLKEIESLIMSMNIRDAKVIIDHWIDELNEQHQTLTEIESKQ